MDLKKNNESPRRIVAGQQSSTHREITKYKDQLSNGLKKSSSFQRKKLHSKVPRIKKESNIDCLKPERILDKPAFSSKPSHIPRRKILYKSKEIGSKECKKEIHTSQKFHVDPIPPRNVQQVQLLINQDLYPEDKKQGISIATTRPLPSLDQIYVRNNVQNTDRLNNFFVEVTNPAPANSRATNCFHKTFAIPSVNVSERKIVLEIRVENKNPALTVSTVEFNGNSFPRPTKRTADIISDWLTNIDDLTMDKESGHHFVTPESRLPIDMKSKSSFFSAKETTSISVHHITEKSCRKSLDYDNTHDLVTEKVQEVIKKQTAGKRSATASQKKNITSSDRSKESKPCIDTIMVDLKARKPTPGSTNIKTYKSNPGGDGKKYVPGHSQYFTEHPSSAAENVQVTVPSYVEYPSEILQRTTNFEDMAMLATLNSSKDTSSIAATDPENPDDDAFSCQSIRRDDLDEQYSADRCSRCRAFESKYDDASSVFDNNPCAWLTGEEEYISHRCSRSRHRHLHRDFRCYTESEQEKRFPSTKYYLPKTLSMLRRRMSMRQCRRGLNRVWKKTAERWAMWSAKSPYRIRKLRVKHYLHRTVIWEDVDVQTSLFVYKEVGTCPSSRMQKSVAVATIYYQKKKAESLNINNRSSVSKPNTIPSMFPYQCPGRSLDSRPKGQERNCRSAIQPTTPKSMSPPRREYSFQSPSRQGKQLELLSAITQTSSIKLNDDHKKVFESDSCNLIEIPMDDKLIGTDDTSTMQDNMTCTSFRMAVVSQLNEGILFQNELLFANKNPDNVTSATNVNAIHQLKTVSTDSVKLLPGYNKPETDDIFHLQDKLSSKLENASPQLCADYENLHKQMLTVSSNPRTNNGSFVNDTVASTSLNVGAVAIASTHRADDISHLQENLSGTNFKDNVTPQLRADSGDLQKQMLTVRSNSRTDNGSFVKDTVASTSLNVGAVPELSAEYENLQNQMPTVCNEPRTDDISHLQDNLNSTNFNDNVTPQLNTDSGNLQKQMLTVCSNSRTNNVSFVKDTVASTSLNIGAVAIASTHKTDDISHLQENLSSTNFNDNVTLHLSPDSGNLQACRNSRTDNGSFVKDTVASTSLNVGAVPELSAEYENLQNQMPTVCNDPRTDDVSHLQDKLSSTNFNDNATPHLSADCGNLQKQRLTVCSNSRTDNGSFVKDTVAKTSLNVGAVPELSTEYENLQNQMPTVCKDSRTDNNISLEKDIVTTTVLNDNASSQLNADYMNLQKQMLTVCNHPRTDNISLVKDTVASISLNVNVVPQLSADYENLQKQMCTVSNIPRMDNISLDNDTIASNYMNVDAVPQLRVDYENLHKQMLTVCNNPKPAIKFPPVAPVKLPTDLSICTNIETVASCKTCGTSTDSKQVNSINIMTSHALMKCSNKISDIETQVTPKVSLIMISTENMVSPSFLKNNSSKVDTATDMPDKVINNKNIAMQSLKSQMRSGYCLTSLFQIDNPLKDADKLSEETCTNDEVTVDSSPSRLLTYFNTGMLINTLMETAILNSRVNTSVSTDTELDRAIGNKTSGISTSTKSLFIKRENVMKCPSRVSVDTNTNLRDRSISSQSRNGHVMKKDSSAGSRKMDNFTQYSSIGSKGSLFHNFERINCSHPVAIRALRVNESEVQTDKNWTSASLVRREFKCASASTSQCVFYNEAEQGPTNDMLSSIMSKQGKISSIMNSGLQMDNASYLDAVKWIKAGLHKVNVSQQDVNNGTYQDKTMRFGYDTASGKASVSKSAKSEFDVKHILEKNSISKLVIPECSLDKKTITIAAGSEHVVKYYPKMCCATNSVAKFGVELPCACISIATGSDSILNDQDLVNNDTYLSNDTTVASALPKTFENGVDLVPERDITNSPKNIDFFATDKIDQDVKGNTVQSSLLGTESESLYAIPENKSTSVYSSRYILPVPKPCTYTNIGQHNGCAEECVFVYEEPRCVVHGHKYNVDVSSQFSDSRSKPFIVAALIPTDSSVIPRSNNQFVCSSGNLTQCCSKADSPLNPRRNNQFVRSSGTLTQSCSKELCDKVPHKRIVGKFTTYYNTKTCTQQTSTSLDQVIAPKELCTKAPQTRAVGITTSYYKTNACTQQTTKCIEQVRTPSELSAKDLHERAVGSPIITQTYFETKTCTQQTTKSLEQVTSPKVYEVLYTTKLLSKKKVSDDVQEADSEKSIQIIEYRGVDAGTVAIGLPERRSVVAAAAPDVLCTSINTSQCKPKRSIDHNDQFTQKGVEVICLLGKHSAAIEASPDMQCVSVNTSQHTKRETETVCLFEKHSAATEASPDMQCVSLNTSQNTKREMQAALFEKHSAATEACPDMQCVSVNTSQLINTRHSVISEQITKETAIKLTTCTQYSFTKTVSKEKKSEEKNNVQLSRLEEVPPEVKNLECLSNDHEKDEFLSSCRYFSSLLSKQLRRVKEQLARHIYNSCHQPSSQIIHPDVCVMKPSARLDLACQTSRSRPGSKLIKAISPQTKTNQPTMSLSNIGQEEKTDLKSVYLMLTAIEGRMRRLKTNLEY